MSAPKFEPQKKVRPSPACSDRIAAGRAAAAALLATKSHRSSLQPPLPLPIPETAALPLLKTPTPLRPSLHSLYRPSAPARAARCAPANLPLPPPSLARGAASIVEAPSVRLTGISSDGNVVCTEAGGVASAAAIHREKRRLDARNEEPLTETSLWLGEAALRFRAQSGNAANAFDPFQLEFRLGIVAHSTFNHYARYFFKFLQFRALEDKDPSIARPLADYNVLATTPICPFFFANYLLISAADDSSISPTDHRCNAAAFFCNLATIAVPTTHPEVSDVRNILLRKLGRRGMAKSPLLGDHLQQIYAKLFPADGSHRNDADELKYFRIRLQWETQTRYSDLAGLNPSLFGDLLITASYIRIFMTTSKTDQIRKGHWVTMLASSNPASAYQSLLRVLRILQQRWDSLPIRVQKQVAADLHVEWEDIQGHHPIPIAQLPIMIQLEDPNRRRADRTFKSRDPVSFLFAQCISRDQHAKDIKECCSLIGLDPQAYSTHSLRSGNTTEQEFLGIPDEIKMIGGNWRSAKVAQGYVAETLRIRGRVQALMLLDRHSEGVGCLEPFAAFNSAA